MNSLGITWEVKISIHPLRGEWDTRRRQSAFAKLPFQSTHSVGSGTTCAKRPSPICVFQSTHSVGSGTAGDGIPGFRFLYFNPPTPWGVGRYAIKSSDIPKTISIHPLRGEWDTFNSHFPGASIISIHPLRGEWDFWLRKNDWENRYFNPPTPWGVGPGNPDELTKTSLFQSTHSVGSGTASRRNALQTAGFQSTHSVGSGTFWILV